MLPGERGPLPSPGSRTPLLGRFPRRLLQCRADVYTYAVSLPTDRLHTAADGLHASLMLRVLGLPLGHLSLTWRQVQVLTLPSQPAGNILLPGHPGNRRLPRSLG